MFLGRLCSWPAAGDSASTVSKTSPSISPSSRAISPSSDTCANLTTFKRAAQCNAWQHQWSRHCHRPFPNNMQLEESIPRYAGNAFEKQSCMPGIKRHCQRCPLSQSGSLSCNFITYLGRCLPLLGDLVMLGRAFLFQSALASCWQGPVLATPPDSLSLFCMDVVSWFSAPVPAVLCVPAGSRPLSSWLPEDGRLRGPPWCFLQGR